MENIDNTVGVDSRLGLFADIKANSPNDNSTDSPSLADFRNWLLPEGYPEDERRKGAGGLLARLRR